MEKQGIDPMVKDLKEQQAIREKLLNNRDSRENTIEPMMNQGTVNMNTVEEEPNQYNDLQEKFIQEASSRFSELSVR